MKLSLKCWNNLRQVVKGGLINILKLTPTQGYQIGKQAAGHGIMAYMVPPKECKAKDSKARNV